MHNAVVPARARDRVVRGRGTQSLDALFEDAPEAVVVTDQSGSILLVNRQTEVLFGYDRDELLTEPFEVLLSTDFGDVHARHREGYLRSPRARPTGLGIELAGRRKDGSLFPVDISLGSLQTEHGTLVTAFVRDVTQRKRVEEETQLLASLSLTVMDAPDLESALTEVLERVRAVTGWPYAEAAVKTSDGSGLLVRVVSHRGDQALQAFADTSMRAALPLSSTPAIPLLARPIPVEDVPFDAISVRAREAGEAGLKAALFVPVLSGAEALSILTFFTDETREQDDHRHILSAAGHLGPVIARKRAEDELRDSGLRLAEAQAVAHIGSWEWDIASDSIEWSDELYRIYGLDRGWVRLTYSEFLERVHPSDRAMVGRRVSDAFREHKPFSFDHRIVRPDGTQRVLHVEGRVMLDAAGMPIRMTGTGQDITERKEAEEARRAGEERLRSTLETANDAFVAMDVNGVITEWNREAEATFGWSRDEAIGRRLPETIMPERYRAAHERGFRRFLETGYGPVLNERVDLDAIRKDGTEFPVEVTIWALRDGEGYSFSAFIRDVTERRRAEESLSRDAALLDLAQDAIMVRDFDGVIRFWNRGAEEMYGWTADEAMGRSATTLLETEFLGENIEDVEDEVSKSGRWAGELAHTCRDGRRIVVASRWALQEYGKEKSPAALEINTDITELKRAEEDLQQKTADLERSNADLAEFAYVASHDLQEPLRMVSSYVQLLAERYQGRLDEEADEFIQFAIDGTRRMRSLIRDLLSYSRVGTAEMSLGRVDVNELVAETLMSLEPLVEQLGVRVEVGPMPVLVADAVHLGQVFQNLVTNAMKFVAPGVVPGVAVVADRESRGWRFSVTDNGIGVDPGYADRIFRPFKRLHTGHEYPGSGLGLSVCKRAVERWGGRVWFEAAPGGGTTFAFTVPDREEVRNGG